MSDAPEKIWVTIGRRGEIITSPDAHIQPKTEVASAFTEYTRTDAIPSAAYVAGLEKALVEARETILDLIHARNSDAEGSDEDWTAEIDAALASRPASPDMRVVTVEQLEYWADVTQSGLVAAEIRAIIGGQS